MQVILLIYVASGHFEISSHYQKPGAIAKMVWDFLPHRGTLIQKVRLMLKHTYF